MAEWTEEELDSMSKPLRELDAAHKEIKTARIVPLETIKAKGAEAAYDKIKDYNENEKFAKAVWKAAIQLTWPEARAQRPKVYTRACYLC